MERDVALMARDVQCGYLSRETAWQMYGVIFKGDSLEVDLETTQALRRLRIPGNEGKDLISQS